jgi:hypothetical protein
VYGVASVLPLTAIVTGPLGVGVGVGLSVGLGLGLSVGLGLGVGAVTWVTGVVEPPLHATSDAANTTMTAALRKSIPAATSLAVRNSPAVY